MKGNGFLKSWTYVDDVDDDGWTSWKLFSILSAHALSLYDMKAFDQGTTVLISLNGRLTIFGRQFIRFQ